LAHVLAGQAGRDIRWFLKTARAGFSQPQDSIRGSIDTRGYAVTGAQMSLCRI